MSMYVYWNENHHLWFTIDKNIDSESKIILFLRLVSSHFEIVN